MSDSEQQQANGHFSDSTARTPTMRPFPRFEHASLPSAGHIRILTLDPSKDPESPLVASLSVVPLAKSFGRSPKFETLSFPPSPPGQAAPIPMLVNGRAMPITVHCDRALRHARLDNKERALWVGEVCINHEDADEMERKEEVKKEVFRRKKGVVTWAPPERKTENAYNYVAFDSAQAVLMMPFGLA